MIESMIFGKEGINIEVSMPSAKAYPTKFRLWDITVNEQQKSLLVAECEPKATRASTAELLGKQLPLDSLVLTIGGKDFYVSPTWFGFKENLIGTAKCVLEDIPWEYTEYELLGMVEEGNCRYYVCRSNDNRLVVEEATGRVEMSEELSKYYFGIEDNRTLGEAAFLHSDRLSREVDKICGIPPRIKKTTGLGALFE